MGSVGHQQYCEFVLSNVSTFEEYFINNLLKFTEDLIRFTFFFKENLEGLNEPLADTLYHPHPGLPLVLHVADVEGHRPELLADLAVELSASLHLEHVAVIRLLVDGDLGVLLPAQALASADQHVYGINLAKVYNSISTHSPNSPHARRSQTFRVLSSAPPKDSG